MLQSHFSAKRSFRQSICLGLASLMLALVSLVVLGGASTPAEAQTAGATVNVFCINYGKTFPEGQSIAASSLAMERVRGGLTYALNKGYIVSNPYEVQLAMWNLADGQPFHDFRGQGTTIAQEIVNNAGVAPGGNASTVSFTVANIKQTPPDSGYGTGTIQGNVDTSGLPVGFLLPASGATFQNMVGVVVTAAAPAATAAPTVAPTAAPAPTSAPTVAPTVRTDPTAAAPSAPSAGFGGASGSGGLNVNNIVAATLGFVAASLLAGAGLLLLPSRRRR